MDCVCDCRRDPTERQDLSSNIDMLEMVVELQRKLDAHTCVGEDCGRDGSDFFPSCNLPIRQVYDEREKPRPLTSERGEVWVVPSAFLDDDGRNE